MIELRPYQNEIVDSIRNAYRSGYKCPLLRLDTGGGKCHGVDTPIMMFDGTIKMVQDVQVGDLLIGPDSKPRRVLSLARGREMLYRVTPVKGDPYTVNESHILSLRRTNTSSDPRYPSQARGGEIVNICVRDYVKSSKRFKHVHKGWRASVDFSSVQKLPVPAYVIGAWLGDGTTGKLSFTTGDTEIAIEFAKYAKSVGMTFSVHPNSDWSVVVNMVSSGGKYGRGGSPFGNALRDLGIFNEKRIPHCYKTASRRDRFELLAGIIDTDGYHGGKGFDLTLKSEKLLDDVIFVARSLGFACYKRTVQKVCHNNGVEGTYYQCHINGPVDLVPCRLPRKFAAPRRQKKNVLNVGIKVEPIGEGEYYGFEIDGDHLYLLGDFTVTHNTVIFSFIVKSSADRGGSPWVLAHRRELIAQISQSLALFGVKHRVCANASAVRKLRIKHFKAFGKVFIDQTAEALVGSVQTIANMLKNPVVKPPSIIIIDEAHHVVEGNQWGAVFDRFPDCKRLKVTATPERTDGKGLGIGFGGYADTMIHGPAMKWLIENGYLSPYVVYGSDHSVQTDDVDLKRNGEFNEDQLEVAAGSKTVVGDAISHYKELAMGKLAVAFCVSIKRSKELAAAFTEAGIPAVHIDGNMDDDERDEAIRGYADGKYMVLCNQNLVSEGFDLASIAQKPITIDCVIDLAPTMSVIKLFQSWGRAFRPAEGKVAIILDHANNWRRHGFPHFTRDWTLQGREKGKRKKKDDEPDVNVRKCPKCGRLHEPSPFCPECFFEYPKQEREIKEIDGTLGLIDPAEAERQQRIAARINQGKAQTEDEMVEKLGYSRARAKKVTAAREAKAKQVAECEELAHEFTRNTGLSAWRGLGVNMGDIKRMKPKELTEFALMVRSKIDGHERRDEDTKQMFA